jgi:ribonucleotide monophosphatase NagD (HAD superfamily)
MTSATGTSTRAFGLLVAGASLVAMHRNLYWRTSDGLQLDAGAYVRGLEEAADVEAVVVGKPAPTFFMAALGEIGGPPERAWMVGATTWRTTCVGRSDSA